MVSATTLENIQEDIRQLRTILLDFRERLVVAEQSDKHAEAFRLTLLQNIKSVTDKIDELRELPTKINILAQDLVELTIMVHKHEDTLLRFEGGLQVARATWLSLAILVSAGVTLFLNWIIRGP